MSVIKIEWLMDSSDCDTCGGGYAEGARVELDGKVALDLRPVATCTGSISYSHKEVLTQLFALLGHSFESEHA